MMALGNTLAGIGPLKIITILVAACLSLLALTNLSAVSSGTIWKSRSSQPSSQETQMPDILKEPSLNTPTNIQRSLQDIQNATLGVCIESPSLVAEADKSSLRSCLLSICQIVAIKETHSS